MAALTAMLVLALAGPAAADPGGSDRLRDDRREITPATPAIDVRILGGDSFVELAVEPGTEVAGGPATGATTTCGSTRRTVKRNDRSPSRWYSESRYGADVPAEADELADPDWRVVADDGVHAWHDHRAHWMNTDRPIGVEPARRRSRRSSSSRSTERRSTSTSARSSWGRSVAGPRRAGGGRGRHPRRRGPGPGQTGGLGSAVGWRRRRSGASARPSAFPCSRWWALWSVLAWAGVASIIGLPGRGCPGPITWLLPAVALAVAVGAIVVVTRGLLVARCGPWSYRPPCLAGAELLLWAWLRRLVVTRALIPTTIPAWLDRAVVAGAVVVGIVAPGRCGGGPPGFSPPGRPARHALSPSLTARRPGPTGHGS